MPNFEHQHRINPHMGMSLPFCAAVFTRNLDAHDLRDRIGVGTEGGDKELGLELPHNMANLQVPTSISPASEDS